ncbi:FIST N-terminal domain-containing protein [soil metagenome]
MLVARELGEKLVAAELKLVVVFADSAIDQPTLARETSKIFGAVPVIGCSTSSVTGTAGLRPHGTVALGLYCDDVRVGIGVATELRTGAQPRTQAAVERAAGGLGLTCETLDPARHVMVTMFDGSSHMEEPFCFASAVAAPQLRVVGGACSARRADGGVRSVFANGEAFEDAGIVIVLEPNVKFEVVTSSHLVPTELRCVVTAATGRTITELDGVPATKRFAELIDKLGGTLGAQTPIEFTFARFIDGLPYVRALASVRPDALELGCSVEIGHVLRIMRPGDLLDQTSRDLAAVAQRLGSVSALLAFSSTLRGVEAQTRGLAEELAWLFDRFPTTGLECFGEQAGMLFVTHGVSALVLGGGDGG